MMTEHELDRNNRQQAEEEVQKEKERLELNIFCSDKSVPCDVKAEAIIDFQTKYGRL
jgi:hypothetical protein|tara:strand:- start:272 stop:442 length:171 start_codon:yes stop_codon:yes gene_type:complete